MVTARVTAPHLASCACGARCPSRRSADGSQVRCLHRLPCRRGGTVATVSVDATPARRDQRPLRLQQLDGSSLHGPAAQPDRQPLHQLQPPRWQRRTVANSWSEHSGQTHPWLQSPSPLRLACPDLPPRRCGRAAAPGKRPRTGWPQSFESPPRSSPAHPTVAQRGQRVAATRREGDRQASPPSTWRALHPSPRQTSTATHCTDRTVQPALAAGAAIASADPPQGAATRCP
mmetsp:Transcript_4738/g.15316  ORF Transcript_4738/g.15316 Transcript_4738/m.15316 type:complete len:231 (+) Transcript_4738:741-1433(+)